jgi:hypothetical protein
MRIHELREIKGKQARLRTERLRAEYKLIERYVNAIVDKVPGVSTSNDAINFLNGWREISYEATRYYG